MEWVGALKTEQAMGNGRYTPRHSLSLVAQASSNGTDARVLIHNLSATGLLIESTLELALDEEIDVELPQSEIQHAKVVWQSDGFYGCQFTTSVSEAGISAARLRSMPLWQQQPASPLEPVAVEDYAPQLRDPSRLSIRRKLGIIAGLAGASWAVIGLGVLLIL